MSTYVYHVITKNNLYLIYAIDSWNNICVFQQYIDNDIQIN